jgi:transcription factor IIIB 90 kDa subunit
MVPKRKGSNAIRAPHQLSTRRFPFASLSLYSVLLLIKSFFVYGLKPKRRKPAAKPRDASTPHGSTAAESVRTLLKQNARYSKRINYDALKDLFADAKDDDEVLYTLEDDKEDDDVNFMLVEEGGGRVGGKCAPTANGVGGIGGGGSTGNNLIDASDLQPDPDDVDDGDASDKGDDFGDGGWEDTYEQEV